MKRIEIRNRPLVAVWAARSDDVFQEVKVNGEEGQKTDQNAIRPCRDPGNGTDQTREDEIVRYDVVVLAPPEQWTWPVTGQQFGDDSEAIEIRSNASDDHDPALSIREAWSRLREAPARQTVRDGVQVSRDSKFDSRPERYGVGVLDVDDPARRWIKNLARGMKQERAHGEDAPRWNDAVHGLRRSYRA
jgi:hypothetical protein